MQKIITSIFVLSVVLLLAAGCEKNEIQYGEFTVVTPNDALIKINNVSHYIGNPLSTLWIDGNRISNPTTSRTPFPGGGYNTGGGSTADYMAFSPGSHNVDIVLANKALTADSTKVFSGSINIEAGKYYTAHITDTGANTQIIAFQDDRSRPDSGVIRYRFVNLMPNVAAVSLYYGTTKIVNSLAYKADTVFTMPVPASSLAWTTRALNGTTTYATYTSASTITNRRTYTVFASGYNGPTSPDPRRPFVSFLLNL